MRAIAVLVMLLVPVAALAQPTRGSDAILDALKTETLLAILQDEAIDAGAALAGDMMSGRAADGWVQTLERINAPSRTGAILRDSFAAALEGRHAGAILDFLAGPLGQRVVDLELSAREALRDPDIEQAVLQRFGEMQDAGDPRVGQVEAFIRVNDLIDANVVGALNANAAFLTGMGAAAGGGRTGRLSEGEILTQVWQQEPELRAETEDWVHAFVVLAYQPLSDTELADYLAFTETQAGQAMNAALFEAFDALFVATSLETGEALGRWMSSEDL